MLRRAVVSINTNVKDLTTYNQLKTGSANLCESRDFFQDKEVRCFSAAETLLKNGGNKNPAS